MIGIDIGSKYIKIVEGSYNKHRKKVHINKICKQAIEEGVIESGEIKDQNILKKEIKKLIKENNIRGRQVSVCLNIEEIVFKTLEIPHVKKKEVSTIVEAQLMELVPEEQEYIIQWETKKITHSKMLNLKIVAIKKEALQAYKILLEELKFKVICITVQECAIRRLLEEKRSIHQRNIIVADIGNESINISTHTKEQMTFFRKSAYSVEQCKKTLVSLGRIKDKDLDFEKLNISSSSLEEDIVLENVITPYMGNIVQQLMSMMQFQLSNKDKQEIECIYVYGGVAKLEGIIDYLQEMLDVPVRQLSDVIKVEGGEEYLQYYNAIATLLKPDDFVSTYKKQKKQSRSYTGYIKLGVVMLMVFSILGIGGLGREESGNIQGQIDEVYQFLNEPQIIEKVEEIRSNISKLEAINNYNEGLAVATEKLYRLPKIDKSLMEGLQKEVPEGIAIKDIRYSKGSLSANIEADTQETINQFIQNMRYSQYVNTLEYSGYTKKGESYEFEIELNVATMKGEEK